MSEKLEIYKKLAEMQEILLATKINKSGKNTHNGARYYELEDLVPPVQLACKKVNCFTYFNFPYDEIIDGYKAELHLINLDDGGKLVFEVPFPVLEKVNNGMNIMQSEGAYLTYLRRYLLLDTFQLIEKEVIDASEQTNDDTTTDTNIKSKGIVMDERPSSLQKVIDKCHEEYSDEECNLQLLKKVSLKMFKNKEITKEERKEIYVYLESKK